VKCFLLTIGFLALLCLNITAQISVSGIVQDENKEGLIGATIVILEASDSTMVNFALSDEEGRFSIEDIELGEYILQLSYVSYANYSQSIRIDGAQKSLELPSFMMQPSTEVLQEVTIKAEHIPMGIRGDTISYNAAAFKTKPGATVEDLLRKMPGIEVARDGSIKAQGEDVNKVLVDGKEFFGNDPKIATQNLEAEAVDKVEVYDKQSEMAEFTGVDDGREEKALNLKLKEEYKKGGFGNVEIAGGTNERYKGKLNYNRFSPSMQASILGASNNINEQAFSFNDYIGFMGGLSNAMSNSNGVIDFGGLFGGQHIVPRGLNQNHAAGLNFNYDFSNQLKLTSNYFFAEKRSDIDEFRKSEQFSDVLEYQSIDTSFTNSKNSNHRVNTKFDYKPNPLWQFIASNNFQGIGNYELQRGSTIYSSVLSDSKTTRDYNIDKNQFGYDGNLQIRKKFLTKGRSLVSSLSYSDVAEDEKQNVLNDYFFNQMSNRINQNQYYDNREKNFGSSISYTEPIAPKRYMSLSYQYQLNKEKPIKDFYDINNQLEVFNDSLSSIYQKELDYHSAGISFRNNGKKAKLNIGLNLQSTSLKGNIDEGTNQFQGRYNHVLPLVDFDYELGRSKGINLNYNTEVSAPRLNQLMPLPDNSNPNILILGNPELTPEYQNNLSIGYNYFDHFNFTSLFSNMNISYVKNRIINEVDILEDFTRVIKPINTNAFISYSGYLSWAQPIRKLGMKYRFSSRLGFTKYESYLNGISSLVNESNSNISFTFENRKKEYVDLAVGVRYDFNTRNYKVNESFNQQFYNYDLFLEWDVFLPKGFTLSGSFDHKRYSSEQFSEAQNFNLLNVKLRKDLLSERLALELSMFDVLNQNIGLSRMGGINSLNESSLNTLSQYVFLGVKYNLGKKKSNGIEIGTD